MLPNDTIILISGVPGSGKTTISYNLLCTYSEIRLIEETDILREALLGFSHYLSVDEKSRIGKIYDHTTLLSYEMAVQQCHIMKYSLKMITQRQQRKGIPTIINGVHVIPSVLYKFLGSDHMVYINLYVSSEDTLLARLSDRNPKLYGKSHIPYLYDMNTTLKRDVDALEQKCENVFSIFTDGLSVEEITVIIRKKLTDLYGS